MAVPAAAIATGAAIVAGGLLRFESEDALQNGPDYIKSGQPEGIVPSVGLAIARQACRRYADGEASLLDDVAVGFETVCRPYLDNIGYGTGPRFEKPYDGGQCPALLYNFLFTSTTVTGLVQERFINGSPGPLGSWSLTAEGPFWIVRIQHSAGSNEQVVESTTRAAPTISNIRVVLPSGQEDNCGNPPPEYIEPVPPEEPGPDTEPYKPGPNIDIDVTVNLRPDALIEVNVGTGPILIPVFGGGSGGDGGTPGEDTSPPNPEPGPENPGGNGGFGGDDEFGEPPAGRRWVGCCLTITETPENRSVIVGSEPEDVYPGVIGNVRLVFAASGTRQTDTPVRITAKKVCVWEPVSKLNPVAIAVDLLPGYGYTFRPYSVPLSD